MDKKFIEDNNKHIKLSVIVAVYNIKEYLNDCLRSLAEQNVKNVEFIIVDDGSTDGSSQICDQWALIDKRFIVIHQKNKGLFLAREVGILKSNGERIIFLDGDDILAKNALNDMLKLIKKCNADIIQFSSRPFNCIDNKQYRDISNYLYTYNKKIERNINIAKSIFVDKNIRWTIWNKIYSAKILKKTCINICDFKCISAEDVYRMFLISYFADTFYSYKTKPLYFYRVNSGISTRKQNLSTFLSHLQYYKIILNINRFLQLNNASTEWYNYLNFMQEYLYASLICIMSNLSETDFQQAFLLFYEKYDIIYCLPWLEQFFIGKQNKLASAYFQSQQKNYINKPISNLNTSKRTIGIFYHRYYNGGIERVISLQIPLFVKLGYNIVLFTEEINKNIEYSLPTDIIRVQLPVSYTQKRADVFQASIKKYNISIVCHHATSSIRLLFDLILLRKTGVRIILTAHEMSCCFMALKAIYPFDRVAVYRLADILLTLSLSEECFYKLCGINTRYLPNPIKYIDKSEITPIDQRTPTVLWVGRISKEKNYKDALKILKVVVNNNKDVVCYIVGSGGIKDNIYLNLFIKIHHLKNNIIHVPYTKDVDFFYKKASVHLVTSSCESFSMVIVEGKAYGLPLVTYDLPTLEVLKNGKGSVRIELHNIQEAADAVLKIIKNREYAKQLAHEARESIEPFLHFDQEKAWSEIFDIATRQSTKVIENNEKNISLFWHNLISMYNEGLFSRPSTKQKLKFLIKRILTYFLPLGSLRRRIAIRIYYSVILNKK